MNQFVLCDAWMHHDNIIFNKKAQTNRFVLHIFVKF